MHIGTPLDENEDTLKYTASQTFYIPNEKAKALYFQATDLLSQSVNFFS